MTLLIFLGKVKCPLTNGRGWWQMAMTLAFVASSEAVTMSLHQLRKKHVINKIQKVIKCSTKHSAKQLVKLWWWYIFTCAYFMSFYFVFLRTRLLFFSPVATGKHNLIYMYCKSINVTTRWWQQSSLYSRFRFKELMTPTAMCCCLAHACTLSLYHCM